MTQTSHYQTQIKFTKFSIYKPQSLTKIAQRNRSTAQWLLAIAQRMHHYNYDAQQQTNHPKH